MNSFLTGLNQTLNLTITENGAVTNKSSLDPVVDFFGIAGAMRDRPEAAADLFEAAFQEDPLTAVRTLFYLRDVRGGQGEREVFKACMRRLCSHEVYPRVVDHIPFYGRWDDLFHSGVTPVVVNQIRDQLNRDCILLDRGESISLMAKWLPSANTSSEKTRALAYELRKALGMTPREYRIVLSALRERIRLLEQDMSKNNWDEIDFSKLPSQAHRRHTKAFLRHTPERYQAYLESVAKGEQKINVKAVYPHEIWQMVRKGETEYANVAWEALPDYTNGKNALVMADVSSSMTWYNNARAMAVSVSLALYFAERNTGPFQGYFMSFSSEPALIKVKGSTLAQRFANIQRAPIGGSTNLMAAFRAILMAGRQAPDEMPEVLYVISDMEFDSATQAVQRYKTVQVPRMNWLTGTVEYQNATVPVDTGSRDTIFESAKREFEAVGLKLPHVVFWNVEARQNQAPALAYDGHVSLVSGLSPTTFSQVVEGKSPRDLVDSVVNGERYQRIVI